MGHPDKSYSRHLQKITTNTNHTPLYGYRDLAEILDVKIGTVEAAVYKYKDIFHPPDGYIHRPPNKAKPMWERERFLKMWKLYKELHP